MGTELLEQRGLVDRAAATYRTEAKRLSADDELLAEKIEYGLSELGRIGEQRETIDDAEIVAGELAVAPTIELHEEEGEEELKHATEEGHGPLTTPGTALDQYTDTISDLLDINGEIAPAPTTPPCSRGSRPRSPWPGPRTSPTPSAACSRTSTPPTTSARASTASWPPWSRPRTSTPPSSTPAPPRPSTSSSRRRSPARRSRKVDKLVEEALDPASADAKLASTPRPGSTS